MQGLAAIPALAAAAAVTDTLRIGSRVQCVDYHVPAVLAKSAATLDLLSDGRFELGLGAGWLQAEYRAIGVPFDAPSTRIDRLAEVVSLVKVHFSGEPIDVSGRHVSVSGYTGVPAPVSKPHPPIMIGGGSRKVLTLAGREADIVSLNFNNRAGVIGPDGRAHVDRGGNGTQADLDQRRRRRPGHGSGSRDRHLLLLHHRRGASGRRAARQCVRPVGRRHACSSARADRIGRRSVRAAGKAT